MPEPRGGSVELAQRQKPDVLPVHILSPEEVQKRLDTSLAKGLTSSDVEERLERFGKNELSHEEGKSVWTLVMEQFEDLLVRILLAAACVSFVLALVDRHGDEGWTAYVEPLVILLILIANALVGVWQESNAEKALEALKSLQPDQALVLRDGTWDTIRAENLVPGDIVDIRVGDKIPADLRLVELKTTTLKVEQSQLTGESQSVQKTPDVLPKSDEGCEIQLKSNCLFSSTTVANGHGIGIVFATGMSTEIGIIQAAVQEAGQEDTSTPLSKKLDEFGALLSKVIGVICIIVWLINIRNFNDPAHGGALRGCIYYFKIAVALAVAAIPEGLPAVITTCLALGTRKMAKRNAIVRRLPSVETLGCTTVICSDKTGTLTTNEMSCLKFYTFGASGEKMERYLVEGTSYLPEGRVLRGGSDDVQCISDKDVCLNWLAKVCSVCNDAALKSTAEGKVQRVGEPTEAALVVLVEKLGCPDPKVKAKFFRKFNASNPQPFGEYYKETTKRLALLEFNRERKSMSVLARDISTKDNVLLCKGAPESVVERCSHIMRPDGSVEALSPAIRQAAFKCVDSMAASALRTLALALKIDTGEFAAYDGPHHQSHKLLTDPATFPKVESNMILLGVVGIMDPPRPEVAHSIALCHNAGIKVIMITGDNKRTAEAISEKIGILRFPPTYTTERSGTLSPCPTPTSTTPTPPSFDGTSFTGKEFEQLSEKEKLEVLQHSEGAVFSRTEPKHKQMIVKLLRDIGEVAAMTGDGVNDAPALKQADIGIAMGLSGTEVAKEASDMVLADDNFSTIVAAVEEGRSIYNNMKAFIRYLISSNIGEVASIFLTAALGIPEGLAPVQLLWVNLVTDGPPATALGFNPPDVDVMRKPPRRSDDALISGWVFFRYMVIGLYVGFATVGIFVWWYVYGIDPTDGHSLVSFQQLRTWSQCTTWNDFDVKTVYGMNPNDPCSYFAAGKVKASTLSLTVLVVIEMLNALNALSEDGSLLQMPPWANPYLILAIFGSLSVHCIILYVPMMARIFSVVPLTLHDWKIVFLWSIPVIIIDELLKFTARMLQPQMLAEPLPEIGPEDSPRSVEAASALTIEESEALRDAPANNLRKRK